MKLYTTATSSSALRVRIALSLKGVKNYETIVVDEHSKSPSAMKQGKASLIYFI